MKNLIVDNAPTIVLALIVLSAVVFAVFMGIDARGGADWAFASLIK